MAELKTIPADEFLVIAAKRNLAWSFRKCLATCDQCREARKNYLGGISCEACGSKGAAIVVFPILKVQKMSAEDFENLRMAIRLGEQYG